MKYMSIEELYEALRHDGFDEDYGFDDLVYDILGYDPDWGSMMFT